MPHIEKIMAGGGGLRRRAPSSGLVTFGVTAEAAVEPPACPFAKPGMDPARRKVDLAETIDRAVKEQVKHVLAEVSRRAAGGAAEVGS